MDNELTMIVLYSDTGGQTVKLEVYVPKELALGYLNQTVEEALDDIVIYCHGVLFQHSWCPGNRHLIIDSTTNKIVYRED